MSEVILRKNIAWTFVSLHAIEQTQLQAFGANLDIKDLEYKNMDDSTSETTTTQASTTVWKSTSASGVTFLGENACWSVER